MPSSTFISFIFLIFCLNTFAKPPPSPSPPPPQPQATQKTLVPFAPHSPPSLAHQPGASPSSALFPQTDHLYAQRDLVSLPIDVRRGLAWSLQIAYQGQSFFDGFDFFTETGTKTQATDVSVMEMEPRLKSDVNYVDQATAFDTGLAFWTDSGVPGIQTEHWATLEVGDSRDSVRITTKALFAGGLFIIDLELMPWGCGVWPAFWTLGYDGVWPDTGEIDIIEGIQSAVFNQMTVHTLPGCTINSTGNLYTGQMLLSDCDSTAGGSGCSIVSDSNVSYGEDFNAAGGGVFAMLWDGDGIRIWNWQRILVPNDISSGVPTPSTWGTPAAAFDASTCDPGTFFQAQELILNIDLCGDWAGDLYSDFSYCPGTCASFIADPANLLNTVMLINSIQVYQQSGYASLPFHAETNANQTGAGGAVAVTNSTNSTSPQLALPESGSFRSTEIVASFVSVLFVTGLIVSAWF